VEVESAEGRTCKGGQPGTRVRWPRLKIEAPALRTERVKGLRQRFVNRPQTQKGGGFLGRCTARGALPRARGRPRAARQREGRGGRTSRLSRLVATKPPRSAGAANVRAQRGARAGAERASRGPAPKKNTIITRGRGLPAILNGNVLQKTIPFTGGTGERGHAGRKKKTGGARLSGPRPGDETTARGKKRKGQKRRKKKTETKKETTKKTAAKRQDLGGRALAGTGRGRGRTRRIDRRDGNPRNRRGRPHNSLVGRSWPGGLAGFRPRQPRVFDLRGMGSSPCRKGPSRPWRGEGRARGKTCITSRGRGAWAGRELGSSASKCLARAFARHWGGRPARASFRSSARASLHGGEGRGIRQ